jgi:hypothetical protein
VAIATPRHLTTSGFARENRTSRSITRSSAIDNDETGAEFMGGPIVRTGTTPAFWANWDKAFGKGKTGGKKKSGKTKTISRKPAKSAKSKKVVKPKKKRK